jgi:hypothetical protein
MNVGIAVDCDKTKEWLRLARKFVLLGRLWEKGGGGWREALWK